MPTKQRKRRRPGEGSVSQRPNGTYVAVVELAPDPKTGKRRRRFLYGKTEAAVLNSLRDARRQLDDSGDLPTSDMLLSKWLTYWLEHIAYDRVKPGTLQSYRTAVTQYLTPSIGKRPLSRLTTTHVRQMHDYVRAKGCNSSTVHNAHVALSVALNDAMREGKVPRNVASLVRRPQKAASKRGALTFPEAKALLTLAANDERTAARWLAAFLLGARQGELLGLRWDYVDLDTGMVDLAWSLQAVRYAHGCTPRGEDPTCGKKTGRACPQRVLPIPDGFESEHLDGNLCLLRPKSRTSRRVIPLPDALWAAFKLHNERTGPNPHGLVWTRPDGRPINPKDDWTAWQDIKTAAGIERKLTLHEARHSTATWLADAGVAENVIVDLLGHSDVIVNRSYQHLSPATGRQALNLLGAQLALPPAVAGA